MNSKLQARLRVLLVDDHQMLREGLRVILTRDEQIQVIGEAENGRSAVKLVAELLPDIVVMDVGLPDMNGIEATRQITSAHPEVKVIALSAYSDPRYVVNMIKAGASGYILKDSAGEELRRGVEAVSRGNEFLSPEVTGAVLDGCLRRPTVTGPATTAFTLLGGREREVLQLLAEGLTSAKIAKRLFISPKTVESHRRNLMKKLDLHSVAELTKYAVREGLTSLEPR